MGKVVLLSVLVAMMVIPIRAAREPRPGRALKQAVLFTLAFNVLYLIGVLVVYPRFAFK